MPINQELVDNLQVVIGHLQNTDDPVEIHTQVMAVLWQANVVVEGQGAAWINSSLERAYGKWASLERPDNLPTDGHRDQWRHAGKHVCEAAQQFADQARQADHLDAGALDWLADKAYQMADDLNEGRPIF